MIAMMGNMDVRIILLSDKPLYFIYGNAVCVNIAYLHR